jgi:RsmE family RNA methyltransferase
MMISSSTAIRLNRILADQVECTFLNGDELMLQIPSDDYRSKHITSILKMKPGEMLRVGVCDLGLNDNGSLQSICSKTGDIVVNLGRQEDLVAAKNPRPIVDLFLAVPRPLRLERLLPVVSMMGIGRLVLLDASRVEKSYFGSHLFRRPEDFRRGLIEGLSQSEVDCWVPEVLVRRNLHRFIEEEQHDMYSKQRVARFVAHPTRTKYDGKDTVANRMSSIAPPDGGLDRVVVTIGPEGGWDHEEIRLMQENGFNPISVGERILRTDVAVPAILAAANEWLDANRLA